MEERVPEKIVRRYSFVDAISPCASVVRITPKINPEKEEGTSPDVSSPESNSDTDEPSWIGPVRRQLKSAAPKPYPRRQWTIFRVPEYIRRGDPNAYEPLVVPIGVYHQYYHSAWRSSTIQDHKWQCVRYLLSRHRNRYRLSELLERCISKMRALDKKVRSCYSDNVSQDEQALAQTMLLDGCFIIHLLLKQATTDGVEAKEEVMVEIEEGRGEDDEGNERMDGEEGDDVEVDIGEEEAIESPVLGMLWISNLVAYDLLKLENQIPFFVVQTLFDILATPADKGLDLPKLALQLFRDIHPNMSKGFTSMPASQVHHLLHLFHSSLVPSQPPQPLASEVMYAKTPPEWIPTATALTRGGIKFKTNEAAGSFLDVSFENGIMVIPPLRIYDYTNALFRNLIAFEQCYPNTRTYITIYAAFMDCIVDDAEDVKLLDSKGILVNRLSTDEAVADLFNKLCVQIHYASDRNYLADVFVRVTEYHESKWHRWRAELIRDYFSSPWAGVAVVAAVLLFLLTIQQSVFAFLDYFYPN